MRGQTSPVPIYEGEDGVIAWMLDGPDASYDGPAAGRRARPSAPSWTPTPRSTRRSTRPRPGSTWPGSCTGEHPEATDPANVTSVLIKTSHHTHYVIGSGANDPQKYSPTASRETLDHSIPYIFTVALQDGAWHHVDSYAPERAGRPDTVELWHKVTTVEDPEWTRRYHSLDIAEKAFGGSVEITLTDGTVITDEIAVADAHPLGARPFAREQYVQQVPHPRRRPRRRSRNRAVPRRRRTPPGTGRRRTRPAEHHRRPGVIDLAAAPEGTVLDAVLHHHARSRSASASASCWPPAPSRSSPAPSTRSPRG